MFVVAELVSLNHHKSVALCILEIVVSPEYTLSEDRSKHMYYLSLDTIS